MAKSDPTKYSHARHTDKVLKGSKARCSQRTVLLEICRRADFYEPCSTFTKGQIESTTGYTRKTVRIALAWLRDEGSIVPIAHFEGGSGRAVTYRLVALGQGGEQDAAQAGQAGPARTFPPAEFSRIHKADGFGAAMRAKEEYERQ